MFFFGLKFNSFLPTIKFINKNIYKSFNKDI